MDERHDSLIGAGWLSAVPASLALTLLFAGFFLS